MTTNIFGDLARRKAAVRILRQAVHVIDCRMWAQDKEVSGEWWTSGPVCASVALTLAMDDLGIEGWEAWSEAARQLRQVVGSEIDPWNDTPGRTKEEVVEALLKAAKELESTS